VIQRSSIHLRQRAELAGERHNRNSDLSFEGIGIPSMFGSMSRQQRAKVAMRTRSTGGGTRRTTRWTRLTMPIFCATRGFSCVNSIRVLGTALDEDTVRFAFVGVGVPATVANTCCWMRFERSLHSNNDTC
jgi:hypothetical protein